MKGYYHSLANASYDWPRFWYPEGTDLKLYGSYLPDPEDSFNHLVNPDIIRVHNIFNQLFNVFLGEPGTGKSTSFRQEFEELRSTWAANGEDAAWLDLGIVTGLADLRILFEEQLIANWLAGSYVLHLFLDSLDEALPAFPSLPKALRQTLESLPRDRLRLSLICRPGEWYASFHNTLTGFSVLEVPRLYIIAPLRREDIFRAAVQAGIQDAEEFIGLITDRDAEPFAATPVTLAFLLAEFLSGKGLPAELSELYRRGCIVLCSEEYNSKRDVSRHLDSDQCVILAGRLACLTELSARPLISGQAADASAEGVLSISSIVGDDEMASGDSFGYLHPVRHRSGTDPAMLAHKIDNAPPTIALLDVPERQRRHLRSS